MQPSEANPYCVHCGDTSLTWIADPAPDLCAGCAAAGLWSAMWGPDRAAEYKALIRRLNQRSTP